MKRLKVILIAAMLGATCGAAFAAEPGSDAERRERMDRAYEDYRNQAPGPAARTESSIKRGAHRAGSAIKHGAQKVGHAVGKGVRKTGEAIGHGGEKLEDKSTPKP
ncbi:MAG TPA: hypothetical protein VNU48_01235 [Burkholderiaceae bacterium]|nr:hypothetical protein [Burkholderiaceae bacterium]